MGQRGVPRECSDGAGMHFGAQVARRPPAEVQRSTAERVHNTPERDALSPRQAPDLEEGLPIKALLDGLIEGRRKRLPRIRHNAGSIALNHAR